MSEFTYTQITEVAGRESHVFDFSVDDVRYRLDFEQVTARQVRELRDRFDLTPGELILRIHYSRAEICEIAAAVYLAKAQAGEPADADELLDSITLGTTLEVHEPEHEAAGASIDLDADPEA